jgi:hypothetical protein
VSLIYSNADKMRCPEPYVRVPSTTPRIQKVVAPPLIPEVSITGITYCAIQDVAVARVVAPTITLCPMVVPTVEDRDADVYGLYCADSLASITLDGNLTYCPRVIYTLDGELTYCL